MQRYLLSALTFFMIGLGFATAIPVRPRYVLTEPPRAPAPAPYVTFNLGGTVWLGKISAAGNRIFIFEADGTVSYRTPTSKIAPYRNRGTWRLEGNVFVFDHFVTKGNTILEFRGIIRDANTIEGESTSKTGGKMRQTLTRTTLVN